MADSSILVKDAVGNTQELATDLVGTVHTTKHLVTGEGTGGAVLVQLSTSPTAVSGTFLTDSQMRATPVPVSGPLTNAELRASAVSVAGPLTDTQMRATAVPVSGPLTDTQLRANPVKTLLNAEVPTVNGTFTLTATTLHADIAIPSGAHAVRLYGTTKFYFAIDGTPLAPSGADNFDGTGGFVQATTIREVRLPTGALILKLKGGAAGSVVDVEFSA